MGFDENYRGCSSRCTLASGSTQLTVSGELDLTETINQRIQFQEEKRQTNIAAVVRRAADVLGDKEVPDSDTDHDWSARFFSDVQDVSSEEMQVLWAKVLAGEVERPGSTSIRTLSILRNIDQVTAGLFKGLCSACVSVTLPNGQFLDARVPSLGGDPALNSLGKHGLSFEELNVLNEYGLIISDYNSWKDLSICIGRVLNEPNHMTFVRIPFGFQGRCWVLDAGAERSLTQEFRVNGVALTRASQGNC